MIFQRTSTTKDEDKVHLTRGMTLDQWEKASGWARYWAILTRTSPSFSRLPRGYVNTLTKEAAMTDMIKQEQVIDLTLHWKSTREARFDTDMNDRAEQIVLNTPDVILVDQFGGTALGAWAGDLPCDNGFGVRCSITVGQALADRLGVEVGYPVSCEPTSQ